MRTEKNAFNKYNKEMEMGLMTMTQKPPKPEKMKNLRRFDNVSALKQPTELTSATTPKNMNLAKKLAPLNNTAK